MIMQDRIDSGFSSVDVFRWGVAAVLVVAGVAGFYYFAEQALLYRVLGLVAVSAIAVVISLGTAHGQRFLGFMREARVEVRKMVWATRAETLQTSLVVFAAVIVMALFLWFLDRVLSWGIALFLGGGQ